MRSSCFRVLSVFVLAAFFAIANFAEEKKPAVLFVSGMGSDFANWALPEKLAVEYGFQTGGCSFGELNWEKLSKFNAVVMFDMSRYNPDTKTVNNVEISPEGFEKISGDMLRFVNEGGGLYMYGVSFNHMGDSWSSQSINRFLEKLDAKVLFEELTDPPREKRQPSGQEVPYALADKIVEHPATAGVKNLWYASGQFSYGPWTRPLFLGKEWTALIFTSDQFKSKPVDEKGWNNYTKEAVTKVQGKVAPIYAVREMGKGRIVLNGGESTISVFGYGFSAFADKAWGRVGMENGLDGIKSDGLILLVSSLKWLTEPSLAGGQLGGFTHVAKPVFKARDPKPMTWGAPGKPGDFKYFKGVFAVIPAIGGGAGTVVEYAAAAKQQGLSYVVCAGLFEKMDKKAWDKMVADCKTASTTDLVVTPAMITRDMQDNYFIQCGYKSWPKDERLHPHNPKRMKDHLQYWMTDCNFPLRAPFNFGKGMYPAWLHSGYDSFAVRTYEDGKLVDEQVEGFMQNQEQGDRSRIIAMNLVTSPAQLAQVKEFTYLQSGNIAQLADSFTQAQFSGGALSFVSTGPLVKYWGMDNSYRDTFGVFFVPGSERWRATLKVNSEKPLKKITIYDSARIYRQFSVSGNSAEISFDGLHDTRHVFTAVIEDVDGGRAMTGSLETLDRHFVQYFCSDRCNIMSGQSTIRTEDGHEETVGSTCNLYKAGRLLVGTVALREELPGIDGSGGGTMFTLYPVMKLRAADGKSEIGSPLHHINRPYENAGTIIFDTPIERRTEATENHIYGHSDYVDPVQPKIDARIVQYHFYRKPVNPSPVMAEFSLTCTDPKGLELVKGDLGYGQIYYHPKSRRYNGGWGTHWSTDQFSQMFFRAWLEKCGDILVVRADGKIESRFTDSMPAGEYSVPSLKPGDSVLCMGWGEGMFVLDGKLDLVFKHIPSEDSWLMFGGSTDTGTLRQGKGTTVRVMNWKIGGTDKDEALISGWKKLGTEFGITDKPAYKVRAEQGEVTSSSYLLEITADDNAFSGTISKADLPQRLPIKVTGLNDKWTAGMIDLARNIWQPLGVYQGAAYATVDLREVEQKLFIGNIVTCDNPDLRLTLLPNAGGAAILDAHNPTSKAVKAKAEIKIASFIAPAQKIELEIPAESSIQKTLQK